MNEQTTDNALTNGTPAEPKPVKKRTTKKTKKEKKVSGPRLSSQRLTVLKATGKSGSVEAISEKTKMDRKAVYHQLWWMRKDGLVKDLEVDVDGVKELMFERTAKGSKILDKVK